MLSYLAYVMRFSGEQDDSYGETLILSALRILQDCPPNGILLRKVCLFQMALFVSYTASGIDGCFPSSHGLVPPKGSIHSSR